MDLGATLEDHDEVTKQELNNSALTDLLVDWE